MPADKPLVPNGTFPDPKERTPTLLIVDDEALLRVALSDYLQDCGYKVLEASTADEDVRMPGSMDGFGLAQWLRAKRPGLPIVLTSGDEKKTSAAKELCENDHFMGKPYDLKMVVAKIRATINVARTKPT